MKLLNKTTAFYIIFTLPALAVISALFFFILHTVFSNQTDYALLKDKGLIISQATKSNTKNNHLYKNINSSFQLREIQPSVYIPDIYSFVSTFDSTEMKYRTYRELRASAQIRGKNYQMVISRSFVDNSSLLYFLITIGVVLFGFLALYFIIINLFISRRIWRPFEQTLSVLRDFTPEQNDAIRFPKTKTDEFAELNYAVERMALRIIRDFNNQKQFIRNVSHEIQTPLSIINSNVELLIQNNNLTKKEIEQIQNISETTNRLSKLNHTLLLLSKIENNQFIDKEPVSINKLLLLVIEKYKPQCDYKKVSIITDLPDSLDVLMNPVLADVLLSNLFLNAVRHNQTGGYISVYAGENTLIIENSGPPLTVNPDSVFEKFVKSGNSPESLGLGLSLVKQICEINHFTILFESSGTTHKMTVRFS